VRVNARDLLPPGNDLLGADLVHVLRPAIAWQIATQAQAIDVLLEFFRPDKLFMATIKEVLQIFQQLPAVRSPYEPFLFELSDALAQKAINVFRQEQIEVMPGALQDTQTISVECPRPDFRFDVVRLPAQPPLDARL